MFDNHDEHDSYCILCWVREMVDPLASLARGRIKAAGRSFRTLAGIERTHKVRYA